MSLVDNEEVVRGIRESVHLVVPRHDGACQLKPIPKFLVPLAAEDGRNEDKTAEARRVAFQLAQDGAGLDGFTQPDFISEQIPNLGILQNAANGVGLVGKQLHAACIETTQTTAGLFMAVVGRHPSSPKLEEKRRLVRERCESLYRVGRSKVAPDVKLGFVQLARPLLVGESQVVDHERPVSALHASDQSTDSETLIGRQEAPRLVRNQRSAEVASIGKHTFKLYRPPIEVDGDAIGVVGERSDLAEPKLLEPGDADLRCKGSPTAHRLLPRPVLRHAFRPRDNSINNLMLKV
jgi:hypothetical protein